MTASSGHLVQVAIGPVQGFIATARRSRDLWFGSYVLSEISKAVACSLHTQGARLVFPAPQRPAEDLAPWSEYLVANIVTAETAAKDLDTAKAQLLEAKDAAKRRWETLCQDARNAIDEIARGEGGGPAAAVASFVEPAIWQAQLGDVVEVFLAAAPLADGYAHANRQLRSLMASRKSSRDFTPFADQERRPKSSLDGAQSSVIAEGASLRQRRRLGVEDAEQLDTAGLVKRVVGRRRGFVPVARVAAAPWIEQAHQTDPRGFDRLVRAVQDLTRDDFATPLDEKRYAEYPWIRPFMYDAEALYAQRVDAMIAAAQYASKGGRPRPDPMDDEGAAARVQALRKALAPLKRRLGEPPAYYALLLADGDRMGALISHAAERPDGADAHRSISAALSGFAQQVPDVMRDHGGACIYSGGDDVLGLVALPAALGCAHALAESFSRVLEPVAHGLGLPAADRPTLSVGLAIAHYLEPLGDVRKLAADAEKLAKGNTLPAGEAKNALGIVAQPRSGEVWSVRLRWNDDRGRELLARWTQAFRDGTLSRGLPHDLLREWRVTTGAFDVEGMNASRLVPFWRGQVTRVLSRKRESGGGDVLAPELAQRLLADLCDVPAGDDPNGGRSESGADRARLKSRLDLLFGALWLSGHVEQGQG